MNAGNWPRVRELFEALVDLEPEEARRRLSQEVTDPDLRAEVESLLDHHSQAGSFLDVPLGMDSLADYRLAPGTTLGPYTLVREVGSGGMGQVYLATDARLNREVCLKSVRYDLAANLGYRERLQQEARLAASLNHPGICAVYALEEFDDELYLVTEFVDGRSLRAEIGSGSRPTPQQVRATMGELAAALGAAHSKGIVHRDLKPENIVRAQDGRLKILDFGLARVAETRNSPKAMATLPGTAVGTLAYMAPEQINGEPLDPRADIFALGVVIYEYATGTHPFSAPTPLATVGRILSDAPVPLGERRPDLWSGVIEAVRMCLLKDPSQRPATTDDVLRLLDTGSGKAAAPTPAPVWWRLHQVAVIAMYAAACGVCWQFKEWAGTESSRWAFLGIGGLAAASGIMRGHLLFTERAHARRLAAERHRARPALRALDLTIALVIFADAVLISALRSVPAVLGMGLAAGLAIASVFIEPATTAAAFDED